MPPTVKGPSGTPDDETVLGQVLSAFKEAERGVNIVINYNGPLPERATADEPTPIETERGSGGGILSSLRSKEGLSALAAGLSVLGANVSLANTIFQAHQPRSPTPLEQRRYPVPDPSDHVWGLSYEEPPVPDQHSVERGSDEGLVPKRFNTLANQLRTQLERSSDPELYRLAKSIQYKVQLPTTPSFSYRKEVIGELLGPVVSAEKKTHHVHIGTPRTTDRSVGRVLFMSGKNVEPPLGQHHCPAQVERWEYGSDGMFYKDPTSHRQVEKGQRYRIDLG